jgi:predicted CXXCH cytochrome family protein
VPRASLIAGLVGLLTALTAVEAALDPHLDPTLVPGSCQACHRGHGETGSPMLGAPQADVCLACHGTPASRVDSARRGMVAPQTGVELLLEPVLAQPFAHPVTAHAYSRSEPNVVTCTSCHSPHRGSRSTVIAAPGGGGPGKRSSTLSPQMLEYEMCLGCHDDRGSMSRSTWGIARLVDPGNASFHPLVAPSVNRAPSVVSQLSGAEINCTDCHGNNDPGGPRGPHGSSVAGLLREDYTVLDGGPESETLYALCYKCHDRQRVLQSPVFPEHYRHVVDLRVSCSTCHDPHGSVDDPALIRIGADNLSVGLMPSVSAGILSFESFGTGGGACYVSCHGHDHAPELYGAGAVIGDPGGPGAERGLDPRAPGDRLEPKRPGGRR